MKTKRHPKKYIALLTSMLLMFVVLGGVGLVNQAQAQVPAPQSQGLVYATFALVLLVAGFQFSERFLSDDSSAASRAASSASVSANPTVMQASIILNQSLQPFPGAGARTILSLAPDGSALAYTDIESQRILLRNLATQETQQIFGDLGGPYFLPTVNSCCCPALVTYSPWQPRAVGYSRYQL